MFTYPESPPVIKIKDPYREPSRKYVIHFLYEPTHADETAILAIACLRNTSIKYHSGLSWVMKITRQDAGHLASLESVASVIPIARLDISEMTNPYAYGAYEPQKMSPWAWN